MKKYKNAKKLNEDELTIGGVRLVTSKDHALLKILGLNIWIVIVVITTQEAMNEVSSSHL